MRFGSWGKGAKERSLKEPRSWRSNVIFNSSVGTVHMNLRGSSECSSVVVICWSPASPIQIYLRIYHTIQNHTPPEPDFLASSREVVLLSPRQMQPSRE